MGLKRYRLDPSTPRRLTPDEVLWLEATPIDHSDIPPLGDEFFSQARGRQRAMSTETDDDEATDYGRYTPEHEPSGEDKLYYLICQSEWQEWRRR